MTHETAQDLSVLAAKSVFVCVFLLLAFRALGKRMVGQMNLYDLVTLMAVSNAVQNAMTQGKGSLWVGLICSTAVLGFAYGITRLFFHLPVAQRALLGTPSVILNDGHVLKDALRREGLSESELSAAIREHGIAGENDVRLAVLEVDGSISIIPRDADRPKRRKKKGE